MQIGVEISRALENKRIFVIDSDEITRAAIQFMLHDENETHEIATVAEAIAKSAGRKVDLIVLGSAVVREHGAGVFDEIAREIPQTRVLLVAECTDDVRDCRQTAHRRIGPPGRKYRARAGPRLFPAPDSLMNRRTRRAPRFGFGETARTDRPQSPTSSRTPGRSASSARLRLLVRQLSGRGGHGAHRRRHAQKRGQNSLSRGRHGP